MIIEIALGIVLAVIILALLPTREVGFSLVRWVVIEQMRLQTGYILQNARRKKSLHSCKPLNIWGD